MVIRGMARRSRFEEAGQNEFGGLFALCFEVRPDENGEATSSAPDHAPLSVDLYGITQYTTQYAT